MTRSGPLFLPLVFVIQKKNFLGLKEGKKKICWRKKNFNKNTRKFAVLETIGKDILTINRSFVQRSTYQNNIIPIVVELERERLGGRSHSHVRQSDCIYLPITSDLAHSDAVRCLRIIMSSNEELLNNRYLLLILLCSDISTNGSLPTSGNNCGEKRAPHFK